MTVSLFLVLFAVGYQQIAALDPSAFSEPLNRTDTLYFVVTVFSTVGFGDISPVSAAARVLASVQMLGDLVLIGRRGQSDAQHCGTWPRQAREGSPVFRLRPGRDGVHVIVSEWSTASDANFAWMTDWMMKLITA